jgi:hypothetical protein
VLAPRSKWRSAVVPNPRERRKACAVAPADEPTRLHTKPRPEPQAVGAPARQRQVEPEQGAPVDKAPPGVAAATTLEAPRPRSPVRPGDLIMLAPNILSVPHWDRLLGGLLYATSPRVDWASLLRRSFSVDVVECPKCHGRLRVVAVITEREPVRRILSHLEMSTDAPPLARARDPTDELDGDRA